MCTLPKFAPFTIIFFINHPATTEIYTLSLHDALPICAAQRARHHGNRNVACGIHADEAADGRNVPVGEGPVRPRGYSLRVVLLSHDQRGSGSGSRGRSEEHTSELQSLRHLVCRLLLEK